MQKKKNADCEYKNDIYFQTYEMPFQELGQCNSKRVDMVFHLDW